MMKDKKIDILAIVGPTATGKTKLGIEIAKKFGGEIINADSMQVYKNLNIGTAKPTIDELEEIPYHLINIVEKNQEFNLFDYVKLAKKTIGDIRERKKLPILVGGTGLYIDSVVSGVKLGVIPEDSNLKQELSQKYDVYGPEYLMAELKKIDVEAANRIDKNNKKRLIRALEINYLTGKTLNEIYRETRNNISEYNTFFLGLNYKDRALLYKNINDRVDKMISLGLLNEARQLFNDGYSKTSIQAIGYKEFENYFNGSNSLNEVIEKIKQNSRRYSKRQMTWFKKNKQILWLSVDEYKNFDDLIRYSCQIIEDYI